MTRRGGKRFASLVLGMCLSRSGFRVVIHADCVHDKIAIQLWILIHEFAHTGDLEVRLTKHMDFSMFIEATPSLLLLNGNITSLNPSEQ